MPEFKAEHELAAWLRKRPREDSLVIAARAALRVAPLLGAGGDDWRSTIVLPLFRGVVAPWAAAKHPARGAEIAAAAARASASAFAASAFAADASASATSAADTDALEHGVTASLLASRPLWLGVVRPDTIAQTWNAMKAALLAAEEDWDVWTDWYDALLEGRLAESEAISLARVTLPEEFWKRGPKAVNAELKRLIEAERGASWTHPIPASPADSADMVDLPTPPSRLQGHAPYFNLSEGRLDVTSPGKLDGARNDLRRLDAIRPLLLDEVTESIEVFGRNTRDGRILDILTKYRTELDHPPEYIKYGALIFLGIELENLTRHLHRENEEKLDKKIEEEEIYTLDRLLDLHGLFVLATEAGRELLDAAERFDDLQEPTGLPISRPKIPPLVPAMIEPAWQDGVLTLPRFPLASEADADSLLAALTLLRGELDELAGEIGEYPNIDQRPAREIARIAARIPLQPPTHTELFRIGHAREIMNALLPTASAEWETTLYARFVAVMVHYDRVLKQFPKWRAFIATAGGSPLTIGQQQQVHIFAVQIAEELRAPELEGDRGPIIDPTIADTIDSVASGEILPSEQVVPSSVGEHSRVPEIDWQQTLDQSNELLAQDLLASVDNLLKRVAEPALAFAMANTAKVGRWIGNKASRFGKAADASLDNTMTELGKSVGPTLVKWLKRGSLMSLLYAAAQRFPDALSWLKAVLDLLKPLF